MTLRILGRVLAIVVTLGSVVARGTDSITLSGTSQVTIENCGVSTTYQQPPRRVVTLNQPATELMLALELQDRLVGTAYLDDAILPVFADAYQKIPVLDRGYPSREALTAVQPDLVLASFSSAFTAEGLGPRADLGVTSYLSPSSCAAPDRVEPASMATVYREIRELGRIFGVAPRAEQLIASYEADLRSIKARIGTITSAPTVFWYNGGSPPSAGACCGMPNEILRLVGAENIFKDTPGSWTSVGWDDVIERDPDVIVLVDAPWSSAVDKALRLTIEPEFTGISAVRQHRLITIDFGSTTPGIRTVAAVRRLAEELYPEKFSPATASADRQPRRLVLEPGH